MGVATDLGARVRRDIDSAWAEAIRLSPMRHQAADPDRDQVTIRAVLRTVDQGRVRFSPGRGESGRVMAATMPASSATLKIDKSAYPDIDLRVGDRVRAMDRAGQPVFEVVTIDPLSHHRLTATLNAMSA